MQSRVRLGAWASMMLIAAAALLGCSVVDRYSSRAIVYNLEAEKAQEQAMLLNVVRASLGRPMQFTAVSTITGTASATGNAQYQFPTGVIGPVIASSGVAFPPVVPSALFGGSVSGGPAFTVPVLDTKEFYSGILTAIPGKIWDLYIQANYPRDLLFNLFVEKVVMQRVDPGCPSNTHIEGCEFVFSNYVAENIQINLFQALSDYLLSLGLTTELTNDAATVPFVNAQSINVRFVGDPATDNPREAQVLGAPGGPDSQGLTASTSYHLCFAPLTLRDTALVKSSLCGPKPKKPAKKKLGSYPASGDPPPGYPPSGGSPGSYAPGGYPPESYQPSGYPPGGKQATGRIEKSGSATVALIASDEFVHRLGGIAETTDQGIYHDLAKSLVLFRNKPVQITVYMRHTEGMIYYLGELVRRQAKDGRDIFVKLDDPYQPHDTAHICLGPTRHCAYIFRLNQGAAPEPGDVVSAFYDGRWFSLPPGSHDDMSSLTFDFLKQQIALNSSAKSLPQSSVLTTVGP
jgi:hypothetical protein